MLLSLEAVVGALSLEAVVSAQSLEAVFGALAGYKPAMVIKQW